MNIDEEMFWMVYVDGGGAPAVRWTSLGQAESEAQRLATKEGRTANGSKFSSTTGCGGSYEFKK
jgi:hypothetical protein